MTLFFSTFGELFFPFFLTCGITGFALLMQRFSALAQLAVEELFTIQEMGLLLLYSIPPVLSITISLGVVGGVFMTVIRKSMDSEIIAIQAGGKSLWMVSTPIAAFGLLAALCALVISVWLQPFAYEKYFSLEAEIVKTSAESRLRPGRFNYQFGGKAIQIGGRDADDVLSGIFIADRVQSGSSSVIMADKGRIAIDSQSRQVMFRLQDGVVYLPGSRPEVLRTMDFERLGYRLDLVEKESRGSSTLNRKATVALWQEARSLPPQSLGYHLRMLHFYSRLALPFACLAFAIAAVPMAIVEPRSGKSGSFLRALFLLAAFYIIWVAFSDLILAGKAPPEIILLPVPLVALYGLLRLWQQNRCISVSNLLRLTGGRAR